ncbi:relaxase/mobilization nuclease domain-containing protein [Bosea eneae]|uniref:Relaxase/mobilization nuclease domain-containing protein n=1 Tax=Bosea eneae TaxID=151454 RepID=A0ABW0IYV9_9HYPH
MYLESIPRRLGGLGRHLMDAGRGSNERVIVRADLSRDVPHDVTLALRMLAAPAHRVARMKREVVHIVISPGRMLSTDEVENVLRAIEKEYGIPEGSARLVVEHEKGQRARHYHVVYSMVSEATGRALRFNRSGDRDEMLARRFEIELGEKIQPSTRVERTAELLRERGLANLAEIAAQGPVAEKGRRTSKAETRQNDRLGVDQVLLDERLRQAWRQSGNDMSRLRLELDAMGFCLAAGDQRIAGVPIVMLVDVETLKSTSLTRHLNRLALHGDGPRFREIAIGASFGELPPLAETKADLRKDALPRSADAVLIEFDRMVAEMEADGEHAEAAKARKGRARLAARLSAEERDDLRTRQDSVKSRYRQRDRIRRARVNRAFIAAKLFGTREIRKAAFYLVAIGILATGAGLIPALAAAGVAVATIPSYSSARRLRATADWEATLERSQMARELADETRSFFRQRVIRQKAASKAAHAEKTRLRIHRNRKRGAPIPQPPPANRRAGQRSRSIRRGGPER